MSTRLGYEGFARIAPAAQATLRALTVAVDASGLDKALTELLKVRISQINACAFCLQFHLTLARKSGVADRKLDLVAVWREAGIFSPREQAALGWAEDLTAIGPHAASDAAYAAVRAEFSEDEIVFLTTAIATINAWNRIAVALRFPPPAPAV
jgi:AhpD family alkylhydroperoxidase